MRMWKFATIVTVAVLSLAGVANAATSTVEPEPLLSNATSMAPGVSVTLPALAANDSVYVYVPAQHYVAPLHSSSGALVYAINYTANITAAAESISCVIGVGPARNGTFSSPFSAALQSLVMIGTVPYVVKNAIASTAFPACGLIRFAFKNKGSALAAGKTITIVFPRVVK